MHAPWSLNFSSSRSLGPVSCWLHHSKRHRPSVHVICLLEIRAPLHPAPTIGFWSCAPAPRVQSFRFWVVMNLASTSPHHCGCREWCPEACEPPSTEGSHHLLLPHPHVSVLPLTLIPSSCPPCLPFLVSLHHPCLSQEDESPRSVLEEMGLA